MLGINGSDPRSAASRRAVLAGPLVAAVALAGALVATSAAGVPLRDPAGVAMRRLETALALAAVLLVVDIVVRAALSERRRRPSLAALVRLRRERWTVARLLAVAAAIVSFHLTYLGYRNLKSVVPLLVPGELYDRPLGNLERSMFGGDPAEFLHSLLGTGGAAHLLSDVYLLFFAFVPLVLTIPLVCSRRLESGLFFATALSINWVLAAVSYLLLPALGPIYADPGAFADLPATSVSRLQDLLLEARSAFLADPGAPGGAQSIGAFASLHTSLYFTAGVAAHLLGYPRLVKAAIWLGMLGTVTATVYFGWHYIVDDLAGILIGALALVLAHAITGFHPRAARQPLPVPSTSAA